MILKLKLNISKNLSSLIFHFSSGKGFTLLELLIVFSVTIILSSIGFASFVNYSRSQTMNVAASDFVTMLNKAKSRAMSQIKIEQGLCAAKALDGYKVSIESSTSYKLAQICEGSEYDIPNESRTVSDDIEISPSTWFLFRVVTGGVEYSGSGNEVTFSGYDITKTVTVESDGRIVY